MINRNLPKSENGKVEGVLLRPMPTFEELRGNLSVGTFGEQIPFEAKRYFLVYGVPREEKRGQHAHRTCAQFLLCIKGICDVIVDDSKNRSSFKLETPKLGLYLPPLTWASQYNFTTDAVLLVFASHEYDEDDYIHSYPEFQKIKSKTIDL